MVRLSYREEDPFLKLKEQRGVNECQRLLVLSENDNMGIRYILMDIYVIILAEEEGRKLRFDVTESGFCWDFPFAFLLYRVRKYAESKKMLESCSRHTLMRSVSSLSTKKK